MGIALLAFSVGMLIFLEASTLGSEQLLGQLPAIVWKWRNLVQFLPQQSSQGQQGGNSSLYLQSSCFLSELSG